MHVFSDDTYFLLVKCTAYTDLIYLVTTYFGSSWAWWRAYTAAGAAVEES
jgi:hypothetical protein